MYGGRWILVNVKAVTGQPPRTGCQAVVQPRNPLSRSHAPVKTQILSIQSTVAAGFVGNSVAGPVLTALGQHPLLVDTILLAAHPGYGKRAGGAVPAGIFDDVLDGLAALTDLSMIGTVISGYLGSADQVGGLARFIDGWKQAGAGSDAGSGAGSGAGSDARSDAGRYILDPVLGDGGRLYVAPELADAMVAELLPRADIITPNRYELSFLSGSPVEDAAAAVTAAHGLIDRFRLQAVIATGIVDGANGTGDLLVGEGGDTCWQPARRDAQNVAGGGDLLTATFAGLVNAGGDTEDAFIRASTLAQAVIAASPGGRDLALLEHLQDVAALASG